MRTIFCNLRLYQLYNIIYFLTITNIYFCFNKYIISIYSTSRKICQLHIFFFFHFCETCTVFSISIFHFVLCLSKQTSKLWILTHKAVLRHIRLLPTGLMSDADGKSGVKSDSIVPELKHV